MPVQAMLNDMLKDSDNVLANALLLSAFHQTHHGDWKVAMAWMKGVVSKRLQLDLSHLHWVDGAGLSRYNLASADDLLRIMAAIYHHPSLSKQLLPMLPEMGLDGTLAHRNSKHFRGRVLAKTGSMQGVSSLVGVIEQRHPRLFAIMMEGVEVERHDFRRAQRWMVSPSQ